MSNFDNPPPVIESEMLREKIKDPSYLPSHEDLIKAFPDVKSWRDFVWGEVYEVLNKEFIEQLANYISGRIVELGGTNENPIVILELGSGNGRLTHFLEQQLQLKSSKCFKITASDSGDWEITPSFPVEKVATNKEVLGKHNPQIVVCSWMPYRADWTADIRACSSVQEYILIGETDYGNCGDHWKTWGLVFGEEGIEHEGQPAPFEQDGFIRVDIESIREEQIARTDYSADNGSHSSTVSFRRNK